MINKYVGLLLFMATFITATLSMENSEKFGDLLTETIKEDEQYKHVALFKAIQQRDIAAVRQYIQLHPEAIHTRDNYYQTPLHIAAWQGFAEITRLLIETGSVVDARDAEEHTPLLLATSKNLATVKVLVTHGADVNAANIDNERPIHEATERDDVSILSYLAAHGGNLEAKGHEDNTPLHLAAYHGHHEAVTFLLSKISLIDPVNENGFTPLYEAVKEGHLPIVKDLVQRGAHFHGPFLEFLPVNAAAAKGKMQILAFFLEQDPRCIDATDDLGHSPIAWATAYGQISVIEFLLSKGVITKGLDGHSLIDPRTVMDLNPLSQPANITNKPVANWRGAFHILLRYGVPIEKWGMHILQMNHSLKELIKKDSNAIFACLEQYINSADLCQLILSFASLANMNTADTKKRKKEGNADSRQDNKKPRHI